MPMKINLKSSKVGKPSKPGKLSFSMKKSSSKPKSASPASQQPTSRLQNVLSQTHPDEHEASEKIISLETYDQEAVDRAKLEQEKEKVLVIRPPAKQSTNEDNIQNGKNKNKHNNDNDEELTYGINIKDGEVSSGANASKANKQNTAFQKSTSEGAQNPTLESYTKVPVDQFGAAFLRGLGWKEKEKDESLSNGGGGNRNNRGQNVGDMVSQAVQRPEFLGLGAKPMPVPEGQAKGSRARKEQQKKYSPIVVRDRKTGKVVNEGELSKEINTKVGESN